MITLKQAAIIMMLHVISAEQKLGKSFHVNFPLSTFHNWIRWHLATENMNGGEEKVTVHQYLTNRRLFFCPSFLFSFALVYFL